MNSESNRSAQSAPRHSRRKIWGFRLFAVVLALLPWALCEGILRVAEWPPTDEYRDPFIGFNESQSLFELNKERNVYEIRPERQVYFRPAEFPAEKSDREFRIFVLGGSTVQGRPYSVETAFPKWFQLQLELAAPDREWTVVNCGGVSYASYRLVPILEEVINYQPDLIILCTGHNEFLEQRTYRDYLEQPAWLRQVGGQARQWATVRAAQKLLGGQENNDREILASEVDARLDYRDALDTYQRDDAWKQAVLDHFSVSLRRMAALCEQNDVPVWLLTPPVNYRDCPPFKTEPQAGHEGIHQELTKALASDWFEQSLPQRRDQLDSLLALDDRNALAWYWLGKTLDEVQDTQGAMTAYQRAVDEDVCPLRATGEIRACLQRTASDADWLELDVAGRLAEQCRGGILDQTVLDDHVHPSIRGHQLIAEMLFETAIPEFGLAATGPSFRSAVDERFEQHFAELPTAYFEHGQGRLKALNLWARGRAIGAKEVQSSSGSTSTPNDTDE